MSISNILNYLNPVASFPQKEIVSDTSYNGWEKPSATDAQYLKFPSNEPSVEIGLPNIIFDTITATLSLPSRIFSFTGQDVTKEVSENTMNVLKDYLHCNQLDHIKIISRLYNPAMIWKRTYTNPRTLLITKLFSGTLNALSQTIFPHRIFGGGINIYDQYTDVITLNSNDISMALFAGAQAKGTAIRRNPILYNSAKDFVPLMTPLQNLNCIRDVLSYLKIRGTKNDLQTAYKALGTSSGMDFAVDILFNPVFSYVTTLATTYALEGHFFSEVVEQPNENVTDFFWRTMKESMKDQFRGYLYALPFICAFSLAGYYYGKRQAEAVNNVIEKQENEQPLVNAPAR